MDTGTEVKRVILDSSGDKGKTKGQRGEPRAMQSVSMEARFSISFPYPILPSSGCCGHGRDLLATVQMKVQHGQGYGARFHGTD